MDKSISKQNTFSRSLYNEAKMGAYYTDLDHCRRIGHLFNFPEEEVCVLEPSIGDGSAVLAITGKQEVESNIKIFGVELNDATYEEISNNPFIDYTLHADFLNSIKVSHNSFSFCFANPPYGDGENERLEKLFLEKLTPYMNANGVIAYVIPFYILNDEKFQRSFLTRYNPAAVFRFDEDVYEQFQQTVLIGVKKTEPGYLRPQLEEWKSRISKKEDLPFLPKSKEEVLKPINLAPSSVEKVEYFTTLKFNAQEAGEKLNTSTLFSNIHKRIFVPEYSSQEIGNPPVPLKKDLLYLLAVSGGGQGLVGSEESKDLHLQRGVAKIVTSVEVVEEKGKEVEVETSYTQIVLNIVENDGTIRVLE